MLPTRCLIGTDAQPGLGFRLVKKESGSDGVDLVTGERVNVKSSNPEEPPQKCLEPASPEPNKDRECTPTSRVVCLLNATRISAGFEKIVRTSLKSPPEDSEFNLFTPGDLEEGVLMGEAASRAELGHGGGQPQPIPSPSEEGNCVGKSGACRFGQ